LCILSDRDIRERLERKDLGIEPFSEKSLTPNGYDLTVKEVVLRQTGEKIQSGEATVPPGASFLISTREYVRMPPDACGQLWIRSSYARRGILAAFGKVEAGFEGELTVGAFNSSHEAVKVPIGDRFCQMAFEKMHSVPEKLYKDRSGNYQGQRGVTLAR
jgi:dCTP deaminase